MFPKEEIPEESGFRNFLKRTLSYENLGKSLLPYSTVDAREKRQPGYKPETELPDIPSPLDVAGKGLGLGIQGIGALRENARENPLPEFLPDIPTPLGVLREGVGTGLSQIGEVIKATPDPVKQKARDRKGGRIDNESYKKESERIKKELRRISKEAKEALKRAN